MSVPRHCLPLLLALLLAAPTAPALAAAAGAPDRAQSRGELLYSTHCIACHTQQVHWRDRKVATSWPRLVAEVRRWQAVQKLRWNAADIDEVARHLNTVHYGHKTPN